MAVVRRNVLADAGARSAYIRGMKLLKHENTTLTTAQFGIPGPVNPVRTYDLFVIWHILTMNTAVPPGGDPHVRNAAHRGPVVGRGALRLPARERHHDQAGGPQRREHRLAGVAAGGLLIGVDRIDDGRRAERYADQ